MTTENHIGRREDDERINLQGFVVVDQATLSQLEGGIRQQLQKAGCKEIVYDKWASAFTEQGQSTELREEPVMLHKIRLAGANQEQGLRVILRGDANEGVKHEVLRAIYMATDLGLEPDEDSRDGEYTQFTFGIQN